MAMGYRVLSAAAATGVQIHVLCEPRGRGLADSRFVTSLTVSHARFDTADAEPMIREINREIAALHIDMVAATDPVTSRFLIATAPRLDAAIFPSPDLETFDLLNDKWRFTELAKSLGFACPTTRLFEDRAALVAAGEAGEFSLPAIVKPLSGSGGVGVMKLDDKDAASVTARIDYSPVLLQTFVEGVDVDATIYCEGGSVLSFISYRRERGVYYFFDSPGMRAELARLAARLCLTGIFNFDLVVDPDAQTHQWLECNPRVFASIDILAFVGLNYFECGLPGRSALETRRVHAKALAAIAGRRLLRWNRLALTTVRFGRSAALDWRFLANRLKDPAPRFHAFVQSHRPQAASTSTISASSSARM
jgi:predicted ATP-grasp superfamily ATP-dependent carboligase